jgi:hypothetical protein
MRTKDEYLDRIVEEKRLTTLELLVDLNHAMIDVGEKGRAIYKNLRPLEVATYGDFLIEFDQKMEDLFEKVHDTFEPIVESALDNTIDTILGSYDDFRAFILNEFGEKDGHS